MWVKGDACLNSDYRTMVSVAVRSPGGRFGFAADRRGRQPISFAHVSDQFHAPCFIRSVSIHVRPGLQQVQQLICCPSVYQKTVPILQGPSTEAQLPGRRGLTECLCLSAAVGSLMSVMPTAAYRTHGWPGRRARVFSDTSDRRRLPDSSARGGAPGIEARAVNSRQRILELHDA